MNKRLKLAVIASFAAAGGCATGGEASKTGWAAHGYFAPVRTDNPEIIGAYATKAECEAAVDNWMSHQVVGTAISGECLPVDKY